MGKSSDEFLYNMCWKLTKIISLTDSIAAGEIDLAEFDSEEQARLAIQFSEVRAITRACSRAARKQNKSTLIVATYDGFSRAYTEYARVVGMLSRQWRTPGELEYRLEKQSALAADQLHRYEMNAEELFEAAQETVATTDTRLLGSGKLGSHCSRTEAGQVPAFAVSSCPDNGELRNLMD
jgi:hypothetical protein